MDAALGWLGQIFDALLRLFPRVVIVRSTHAGVRFRNGKQTLAIKPGLMVYWPLTTEVSLYPVERQTANLENQTLCTKDGRVIGVGGIVVYRVRDCVAFLTKTYDGEDTIRDLALSAVANVVSENNYDWLHGQADELNKQLTKALKGELRGFGVTVVKASLSDFFPCNYVLATWQPGERVSGERYLTE